MPDPLGHVHALTCPRCGYDLSGLFTSSMRTDSCAARCSECGLELAWPDILDPARRDVPWLFEHAHRGSLSLRRACQTLFCTLLPWTFWSRLDIRSRASLRRVLLWLALLVGSLHLAWALITATRVVLVLRSVAPLSVSGPQIASSCTTALMHPLGLLPTGSFRLRYMPDAAGVVPLGMTLAAPLLLLLLTRGHQAGMPRVKPLHVLRAGLYGAAWIVPWYLFWTTRSFMSLAEQVFPALNVPALPTRFSLPAVLGLPARLSTMWPLGLALVVWLGAWWWFALHRGLRIDRATPIWCVLMLGSLIVGLLCGLLDPRLLRWLSGL